VRPRKLTVVSDSDVNVGRAGVEAWLRQAPVAELLPPRRRDGATPAGPARPLDHLALAPGLSLVVADVGDAFAVIPVADADGHRRAVAGDGAFAAMLRPMLEARRIGAFSGDAVAAGHRVGPPTAVPPDAADERAIDVDQSNDSVVVGGASVVKVFPLTGSGPQPGLDLPVHLASVGFTSLPRPLGALRWRSPSGDDVVLATAVAYLPGARDGWAWYLERVLAWIDGAASLDVATDPARRLGAIAARMHASLATPSPVLPDPVREADGATVGSWRRSALETAEQAFALTEGEEGARLRAREAAIRDAIDVLGDAAGALTTRVHGDFHVGQVLEWDGGYAVTDFDGNPVAPPDRRTALDTPVRDVAAFVRSIDHLGRVAWARRPGRDRLVETWIGVGRAGFLESYLEELEVREAGRLFDERLLRPLEVAQACHEYVYAARFLPRWRYVPDLAMQALIAGD
jgi:maltokinase